MADDDNTNPPPEGTAPPAAASFSEADVAAILEADRKSRAPSTPPTGGDDPISRFRTSSSGTKLYADKSTPKPAEPAQRPGGTRIESLLEGMLAVQIAGMKPPAPIAPPKVLTAREKLAANDPTVFTSTGGANSWSKADTEALARDHAIELTRAGFKGNVEEEARRRASHDVVIAGTAAMRDIKVVL